MGSRALSLTDRLTNLLGDLPFRLALLERGEHEVAKVRRRLKENGVSVTAFDKAMAAAEEELFQAHKKSAADARTSLQEPGYEVLDGRICKVVTVFDDEGNPKDKDVPLANFSAFIDQEEILDNGSGTVQRRSRLRAKLADGRELPPVYMEAADFKDTLWAMRLLGAGANINADTRASEMRAAIQALSNPALRRIFKQLGLREVDGRWVFLHAGGAIGADGLTVEVDGQLSAYCLPESGGDLTEAIAASMQLLYVAPFEIMVVLLAAAFRAPLNAWLYMDSAIWLEGLTGSMKSTLAALVLCHFGRFDHDHLPASWNDTTASLEMKMFLAACVLLVLDDWAPRRADGGDELRKKAAMVHRNLGNQASRARMSADMTPRTSYPPRAVVLTTAEELPTEASIIARLVILSLQPGAVDVARLTEMQKKEDLLARSMRGYIEWLCKHAERVRGSLESRFTHWRARFRSVGGHMRSPAALAHLALGLEFFTLYAKEAGALPNPEEWLQGCIEALTTVGRNQVFFSAPADPVGQFLSVLGTLLTQYKVELYDVGDDLNADGRARKDGGLKELRPPGEPIGWKDETHAYLLPNASYRAVTRALAESGQNLPITEATLWERMDQKGLLAQREKKHLQIRRTLGGKSRRVYMVALSRLGFGANEPDDDGGGGTGLTGRTPQGDPTSNPNPPACSTGYGGAQSALTTLTTLTEKTLNGSEKREETVSAGRPLTGASAAGQSGPGGPFDWWSLPADGLPSETSIATARRILTTEGAVAVRFTQPPMVELANTSESTTLNVAALAIVGPPDQLLPRVQVVGTGLAPLLREVQKHYGVNFPRVWDTNVAARLLQGTLKGKSAEAPLPTHEGWSSTLFELYERQVAACRELGLDEVAQLEMSILPVVADMETVGLGIDTGKLRKRLAELRATHAELQLRLENRLGAAPTSGSQWSAALQDVSLAEGSEEAAALRAATNRWRSLTSLLSDVGPKLLEAATSEGDARVRAHFNQLGTLTGRFTTSRPNLLGMPRELRDCVVPAPGYSFIVADYATLHMRILAHITQDEELLRVFNAGEDVHVHTASLMSGKAEAEVTPAERDAAKAVNYGLVLGMGEVALANYAEEQYGVKMTPADAAKFRDAFLRAHPRVAAWRDETLFRMLPELRTRSGRGVVFESRRDEGLSRLAFPLQGTEADGIKRSISLLAPRLRPYGGRILLCAHDELLVEVPSAQAELAKPVVVEAMTEGMRSYIQSVPVVVSARIAASWSK